MTKNAKRNDLTFFILLSGVLLVHTLYVFIHPFYYDESYYLTVPLRLLSGDSLMQHEWHLTEFSSLFTYLPVYIWTAIKGSTEGIFIFARLVYLSLHTAMAVVIYRFFRKYGKWAIMASMIFYVQMPYRFMAINYQSVFVIGLLLFSFCLIKIYEKNTTPFYIIAGICFGCCCVCNPILCVVYVLYLLICALWKKRYLLKKLITKLKNSNKEKADEKPSKKKKKTVEEATPPQPLCDESYDRFFDIKALLRFTCGIAIVAVIAIIFFFATGGTINSILSNIENVFLTSEYSLVTQIDYSNTSKILQTLQYFSEANLGMPWILPLIFVLLFTDKKRKLSSHRLFYLVVSLLWGIMFGTVILIKFNAPLCAVSLPFFVISTICYVLTEKKNKLLFNCMYMPCVLASLFQYMASNTHLTAIGIVLAAGNVAGVIFAKDLWNEMRKNTEADNKKLFAVCRGLIIVGFCFQLLCYGIYASLGQFPGTDEYKATEGPFAGLYMTEQEYTDYNEALSDIEYIKSISDENDPVLIASINNWWYLWIDRPFATYSAWYQRGFYQPLFEPYYEANPDRKPKYMYIENSVADEHLLEITRNMARDMFNVTKEEELSNGVLLTIEY